MSRDPRDPVTSLRLDREVKRRIYEHSPAGMGVFIREAIERELERREALAQSQ